MAFGPSLELPLMSQIRLLEELPAFLSVCLYFERVPFVNLFWLVFLEHLCPVVSHACWLPVELNLETYLFLEENAVIVLTCTFWKACQDYCPLFSQMTSCWDAEGNNVADHPKSIGKNPEDPTYTHPSILTSDNALSSLFLSAGSSIGNWAGSFLPGFMTPKTSEWLIAQ